MARALGVFDPELTARHGVRVGRSFREAPSRAAAGLLWLAAGLLVAGCGGPQAVAAPHPAPGMALRAGDLPAGMTRCAASGEITGYLSRLRAGGSADAQPAADDWAAAQRVGSVSGEVEVWADGVEGCNQLLAGVPAPGATHSRIALNAVLGFASSRQAGAYQEGKAGAVNTGAVVLQGGTLTRGDATGLGDHALVAAVDVFGQPYQQAIWSRARWVSTMVTENLSAGEAAAALGRVDGRLRG